MLNKHSSARSLAFVFSEMLMRNFRAFMLLLEHLERDALGKNSAWGLRSSICLHVNHFQSKLRVSWALRWVHCCLHQILNLAVLVGTAHLLLYQSSLQRVTTNSKRRACSFNPKNSVRCFLNSNTLVWLSLSTGTRLRWSSIATSSPFRKKKTRYHFYDSTHG